MIDSSTNIKSNCTASLKEDESLLLVTALLVGLAHILQMRHVSTTLAIRATTSSLHPAALSRVDILAALACHHLK